jgi:hypothetical protein
MFGKIS